jgi:hypothetical protein
MNITFKQQFTFNEEAVKGFAIHLGWKEKILVPVEENNPYSQMEEIDNPQTFIDYVDEKAREHTLLFTKSWANKLKDEYLNAQIQTLKDDVEPTLYLQIVKPVEDALTSEIIEG